MHPTSHPLLEPLRVLNRLWTDSQQSFYLFFAQPIDTMQFGFLQTCKPGSKPYWETFRIYVVDDCYVKLNPASQHRDFGEYDLKTTNNPNETVFVFENPKSELERMISFSYNHTSQQLYMQAIGTRDHKPYHSTWTASPV